MSPFYEAGRYRARVTSQWFEEANTGTPTFVLRFQVLNGIAPFNDSLPSMERTAYISLTEKTVERVIENLRSIGFKGQSFLELDPGVEGFHNFAGKEIEVHCRHEPDQVNQMRERWSLRVENRKPPFDKQKLRQLDQFMARRRGDWRVPPHGGSTPGAPPDDVPF
jgi:hypothetical protein